MKKLLLIPIIALLQACAIYGLTDDYKKLTDEQKAHIVPADFGNEKQDFVYKVTGRELLNEIQKHDKALVYEFTNGCSSDYCKPMRVYENFAKKNGYKLFLVMNGFGHIDETMAQRNSFESPVYAIDSKAYRSSIRSKYTQTFRKELTGNKFDKKNWGGLLFFENGKFVKQVNELPES